MENLTVKNSDILHDPILLIKSGDLSTQLHAILCKKKLANHELCNFLTLDKRVN